jgi:fructose-1,6-bisphosphatase/inositol monophosphatase family enzyme
MKIETRQIRAAVDAVYGAGTLLLRGQTEVSWKLKEDGTFVTELDLQTQQSLQAHLAHIFPEYVFIGEEDRQTWSLAALPQCRIILDPIDGTGPFARGLNYFAISLAVIDELHQPLLALVHLPGLGKWGVASFEDQVPTRYQVACSGSCLRVSESKPIPSIRMGWRVEDSYTYVGSNAHQQLDLSSYPGKIRALGATAAHLLLLLDLTLDPAAVILTRYRMWDAAAGAALAYANGLEIRNIATGTTCQPGEMFTEGTDIAPVLMVGHPKVLGDLAGFVRLRGG